jgi:hypothetical protein
MTRRLLVWAGLFLCVGAAASLAKSTADTESLAQILLIVVAVIFLVRKLTPVSNPALEAGANLMDFGVAFVAPVVISERIKEWDLANQSLLALLGYMLGFLDAAYQQSQPARYNQRLVEAAFYAAIERNLKGIPGMQGHLTLGKLDPGSFIAALQAEPSFMRGQIVGGDEFIENVKAHREKRPGRFPAKGLFELLRGPDLARVS